MPHNVRAGGRAFNGNLGRAHCRLHLHTAKWSSGLQICNLANKNNTLPPPRLPAFLNLQEAILENMIQNILVEASRGEVVLTSRPRIIALPPVSFHRSEPGVILIAWRGARQERHSDAVGSPTLIPTLGFLFCRPDILLPMQQGEVLCSEMQHPTADCLLGSASSPSYIPA